MRDETPPPWADEQQANAAEGDVPPDCGADRDAIAEAKETAQENIMPRQSKAAVAPQGLVSSGVSAVARVLALIDVPFAHLDPKVKQVIGIIAVATGAMAAATWLLGDLITSHAGHLVGAALSSQAAM